METVARKRVSYFSGKGKVKTVSLWENLLGKTVILIPEKGGFFLVDSLEKVFINLVKKGPEIPDIFLEKIGIARGVFFDIPCLNSNGELIAFKGEEIGFFQNKKALAESLGMAECFFCKGYGDKKNDLNGKPICKACNSKVKPCAKCESLSFDPGCYPGLAGYYCKKCEQHLFRCRDCGEFHDEKNQCERSKRRLMEIQGHGFHPPIFYKSKLTGSKFPLYAGMEYEITTPCPQETLRFYREKYGDLFWGVSDSTCDGVELISQPMTLEDWKGLNFEVHPEARRDGSGIHIHLDREGHTSAQLRDLVSFFWKNPKFVKTVAERESDYAKIRDPKGYGKDPDMLSLIGGEKYSAINFCHQNTIEYRIFKTHNRVENILKNIEFCFSLFGWTKGGSTGKATLADYLAYVKSEKTTFNNLEAFLEKEKICV
jgi:hypothetical protein